jgi:A/G-specific adenine glycosylase
MRRRLVAWYRRSRRDLPWRRVTDPYAIWVSEIMLQQTRVETVVPYFARFLARFPSAAALAVAPVDEVLALWSGLGYYARARHLHAAARLVMVRHAGRIPREEAALLALPGIGRYTAGAIRSIAFGERAPVLDGNVTRVLARFFAISGDPRTPRVSRQLWDLAAALVAREPPGEVNQGLMEIGATVCTPGTPDCHLCPLRAGCAARARGEPERFPGARARRAVPEVQLVAALVLRGPQQRVLLVQRPLRGLWGGLWDLPNGERAPGEEPAAALRRAVFERLAVEALVGERIASLTHVLTHRRMELTVYRCRLERDPGPRGGGGTSPSWGWFSFVQIDKIPLSRFTTRALSASGVALPVRPR